MSDAVCWVIVKRLFYYEEIIANPTSLNIYAKNLPSKQRANYRSVANAFKERYGNRGYDITLRGDKTSNGGAYFKNSNGISRNASSRRTHGRANEFANKVVAMERVKELEKGLIGLMHALGISEVRMMLSLAIIRACHLHEEMLRWIASYKGKEDAMTGRAFISRLGKLTEDNIDKEWDRIK